MKKRLFIGIPLTKEIKEHIKNQNIQFPGRTVPEDKWHFTLQFLGSIEESLIPEICESLDALQFTEEFICEITHFGNFPKITNAKILWLGVTQGETEFLALFNQINQALKGKFAIDERPYIPHVTLSRFPRPIHLGSWMENTPFEKISFNINELVLYESVLGKAGDSYIELYHVPLGKR